MGVMRHLADFLRMLSVPCRVSYLPLLHEIIHSTNPFNWRLRQCLAIQAPDLLLLPPPELVFNTLYLLIITLLQDPVASVRKDSFTGVAKMMTVLSEHADALSAFACLKDMKLCTRSSSNILNSYSESKIDVRSAEEADRWSARVLANTAAHHVGIVARAINSLILSKTYQLRQLWVELSHALLREVPANLFEKYFLDGLLYLTSDHVSNVRVAVGLVLAGWGPDEAPTLPEMRPWKLHPESHGKERKGSPWVWLLSRPDVKECVQRLSRDDKDVYLSIVKLQTVYPDIEAEMISCRGMKEAPGGTIPVPNVITGAFNAGANSSSNEMNDFDNNSMEDELNGDSQRKSKKDYSVAVENHLNETLPSTSEYGIALNSPIGSEKDRGNGFGVKSPERGSGVLPAAIAGLMQQQEEEIEQERLMHLKKSFVLSSEAAEEKVDMSHNCLDALMRVEGERVFTEARPRGMSLPGEIIYDDLHDEEEEEEDEEENPPEPVSSTQDLHGSLLLEHTKYAEQDSPPALFSAPSSSSVPPMNLSVLASPFDSLPPLHAEVPTVEDEDTAASNRSFSLLTMNDNLPDPPIGSKIRQNMRST